LKLPNLRDINWTLPLISRSIIAITVVIQIVLLLVDAAPWELNESVSFWVMSIIMFGLMFSPSLLLSMITFEVSGRSTKSWIVFSLSIMLLLSTVWVYTNTLFLIAEAPQNAQAGVALVILPFYQIIGGGLLGGIGWGLTYFFGDESE